MPFMLHGESAAPNQYSMRDEIEMEEMRRNMAMGSNQMHAARAKEDRQRANQKLFIAKAQVATNEAARMNAEHAQKEAFAENQRLKAENEHLKAEKSGGKKKGNVKRKKQQSGTVPMSNVEGFTVHNVGEPCIVTGRGSGVVRFVGLHATKNEPRIGVVLKTPNGKNNGTVESHTYFKCKSGHGLLTRPGKVQLKSNAGTRRHNWSVPTRGVPMSNVTGFKVSDIGKACVVTGVGSGTVRFVGFHAEKDEPRIGVEMNEQSGNNDGTVNGNTYFTCKRGFGLLAHPSNVVIQSRSILLLRGSGAENRTVAAPVKSAAHLSRQIAARAAEGIINEANFEPLSQSPLSYIQRTPSIGSSGPIARTFFGSEEAVAETAFDNGCAGQVLMVHRVSGQTVRGTKPQRRTIKSVSSL